MYKMEKMQYDSFFFFSTVMIRLLVWNSFLHLVGRPHCMWFTSPGCPKNKTKKKAQSSFSDDYKSFRTPWFVQYNYII